MKIIVISPKGCDLRTTINSLSRIGCEYHLQAAPSTCWNGLSAIVGADPEVAREYVGVMSSIETGFSIGFDPIVIARAGFEFNCDKPMIAEQAIQGDFVELGESTGDCFAVSRRLAKDLLSSDAVFCHGSVWEEIAVAARRIGGKFIKSKFQL